MKIGIVAQAGNPRAADLAGELINRLENHSVDAVIDSATGAVLDLTGIAPGEMDTADLIVSIGGDGTFLFVAREVGSVPILGINLGEVGFLNPVHPSNAVDTVEDIVETFRSESMVPGRPVDRIAANIDRLPPAVNEIVVQGARRGHGGGATLDVLVDDESYSSGHADGVIVATTTGSTAYNLSERGPIVHPDLPGIIITEMCATTPMPSLVVPIDSTIVIDIRESERAFVISDGRERVAIEPPEQVTIARSTNPIHIAGPPVNFFEALQKLE